MNTGESMLPVLNAWLSMVSGFSPPCYSYSGLPVLPRVERREEGARVA